MVFSASSIHSLETKGSTWGIFLRQVVFLILSVPVVLVAIKLKLAQWKLLARLSIVTSALLLLVLRIPGIGKSVNGNTNWISLGFVDVQPSELVKFLMILWAAYMLAAREGAGIHRFNVIALLTPGFVFITALIMLGKDLGTSVVVLGILVGLLFVSGIPLRAFGVIAAGGLAAIAFFILTASYRAARVLVVLNPFAPDEYKNAGWQPAHSILGLASGGLFGVGLGASRQKWGNLAEAHTDFIFSVIGEELGLFGTLAVLLMLATLVFSIFHIALRSSDPMSRFAATGIGCWIALQTILNIGSATSLLPVVGVTLPLVSYGGSALIATYLGIGFVIGVALRDPQIRAALKERSK